MTDVSAVEYLRVSTERREYSLDCQSARIAKYARESGFAVCQTEGCSEGPLRLQRTTTVLLETIKTLLGLFRLQSRAGERPAKASLSARSALCVDHLAIAIDDDVDGITVGGVHRGQIGVAGHHDVTLPGMILQILLHYLLGLAHVNRDHNQTLAGKFWGEVVHQRFLTLAVGIPRGPELK